MATPAVQAPGFQRRRVGDVMVTALNDGFIATYLKQPEGGRIVSVAAIIAVAVNTDAKREIVGLHIGPSEAEPFWSGFLKSLARRGLGGAKLVISDAHEGLKAAISRVLHATWQRCRVPLDEERAGLRAEKPGQHGIRGTAASVSAARPRTPPGRRGVTSPIRCGRVSRSWPG